MPVGEPVVTREHGDAKITLRKLTPYDRSEVVRRDAVRERNRLKADLKDVGADAAAVIATLRDFDADRRANANIFISVFDTPDGKVDIFTIAATAFSMTPQGPAWDLPDLTPVLNYLATLSPGEQTLLAAELSGIALESPNENESEADAYGDPPAVDTPTPFQQGIVLSTTPIPTI
jgi:hypothetical protein